MTRALETGASEHSRHRKEDQKGEYYFSQIKPRDHKDAIKLYDRTTHVILCDAHG